MKIPTSEKGDPARQGFPSEVFPDKLQAIAQEYSKALQFHPDHVGLAMLTALSAAIGTKAKVQVRNMHTEPAIIWAVLVGKPGDAKTHIINHLFKPFSVLDDQRYDLYEKEAELYDMESKGRKPTYFQSVLRDFTFEALAESSKHNPKGCIVLSDEILSLTGNFNKFNKGSDEPYYLTLFSGLGISTTRKTQAPIHTKRSCINIIGGIQPAKLRDLLTKTRFDSGFADRFLFAYPDSNAKPWGSDQFDLDLAESYRQIIFGIHKLELPELVSFNPEAWAALRDWQRINTEFVNDLNEVSDPMAGLRKKWESYICRFALILQITDDYCQDKETSCIDLESVEKAIVLFDHFLGQTQKVFGLISRPSELDQLNEKQLSLYSGLTEKFTRSEAQEIGKRLKISQPTIDRYIAARSVYKSDGNGNYEKRAL